MPFGNISVWTVTFSQEFLADRFSVKKPIKAEISSPVYQVCYQPFNVCLLLIELKDLIDLFAADLVIGVRERLPERSQEKLFI